MISKNKKKIKSLFYLTKTDVKLFVLSLIIFLPIDLITKYFAFKIQNEGIYICSIINFFKVKNYGISFGLLSKNSDTSIYFILLTNIVIMCYLFYCFKLKNNYKYPTLFVFNACLILCGAIGNFIDRIYYGFVRDFIDVHLREYHWPCFNVADVYICIGVGLFIVCELFFKKN